MESHSMETEHEAPPHAVCFPFPAQGHITPMLALAKLLHSRRGFHITFVNTEFNHRRLVKSRGAASVSGLPSFRFAAIPDGLPPSDADATQDIAALCAANERICLGPLRSFLQELNETAPVTCFISDLVFFSAVDAARELAVPVLLLWTAGACSFIPMMHTRKFIEDGVVPLKDADCLTNGYLDDTMVDWIPGMEGIRLKDLPTFFRTADANDFAINNGIKAIDKAREASALLFNTFDDLEPQFLQGIASQYPPPLFSIGPLHLTLNRFPDPNLVPIGSNLWKDEPRCLDWLDSREPCSVVYVNFGSVAILTTEQLVEFAWGLADSGKAFLWVIRPDLVVGESAVLSTEFVEETKERGLLSSWCDQDEVLRHGSVGAFLTHCGWNSTVESVSAGVPMLCWPFFSDQLTNCWLACRKLGVGLEIGGGGVERSEVEKLVREVMDGDGGKLMKAAAMELRSMAAKAVLLPNGSSSCNFNKMVDEVILKNGR